MRDPLSSWLISLYAPEGAEPGARRTRLGLLEGYTSLVVNTVLFAVKLVIGLLCHSIAVIADGVHSLSDSATSVVVIIAARVSRRPADSEHPFGHGRAELIGALVVAVLLGVAAVEFAKGSVERILHPAPLDIPLWAIAGVAATALVKQWLTVFAGELARLTGSKALEADAWHHKSDVASTVLVLVAMAAARFGVTWLDGVMGVAVSAVIGWAAYRIAIDAVTPLLGEAPAVAELAEIAEQAHAVDGVRGVHDIVVHRYGETRIVSLHIETSETMSARDSHLLAERVQDRVGRGAQGMVVVHVDPVNDDHPHYLAVQQIMAQLVEADPRLESFHDLRLVGDATQFTVLVDVTVHDTVDDTARTEIVATVEQQLAQSYGTVRAVVNFEPVFAYGDLRRTSPTSAQ